MNGKYKVLIFCILFALPAFNGHNEMQQQPLAKMDFTGAWKFVKTEYMERQTPTEPYHVKTKWCE